MYKEANLANKKYYKIKFKLHLRSVEINILAVPRKYQFKKAVACIKELLCMNYCTPSDSGMSKADQTETTSSKLTTRTLELVINNIEKISLRI